MMMPDSLSRSYAAILPDLKRLGYRAGLKPGYPSDGWRFILTVSRHAGAYILGDGRWERDDGAEGESPADLLAAYRADRLDEARRNLHAMDAKGMARDLIELESGTPVNTVLDATWDGDTLHVEWRGDNRPPATGRLDHARDRLARLIPTLEAAWDRP